MLEQNEFKLTVGKSHDGKKIAIISKGGHPQITNSGKCEVLTVEVVDGWGKGKINDWYDNMLITQPWEPRQ